MEMLIYFVTVVPVGLIFLTWMAIRDHRVVPVGHNFMPTLKEIKDFVDG